MPELMAEAVFSMNTDDGSKKCIYESTILELPFMCDKALTLL